MPVADVVAGQCEEHAVTCGNVFKQIIKPFEVFDAARYYPFFNWEAEQTLHVGVDFIQSPYDDEPVKAINLLFEEPRDWKPLPIRPEPNKNQKKNS